MNPDRNFIFLCNTKILLRPKINKLSRIYLEQDKFISFKLPILYLLKGDMKIFSWRSFPVALGYILLSRLFVSRTGFLEIKPAAVNLVFNCPLGRTDVAGGIIENYCSTSTIAYYDNLLRLGPLSG